MQRLLLPIPGHIIGVYIGSYFLELTNTIYIGQILLIVITAIIWLWSVISSSMIYNSYQMKRKNDSFQIRHNYVFFDSFVTLLPIFQSFLPYLIAVFISSTTKSIINAMITALISIFVIFFVLLNHLYYDDSMNKFVIYLALIKIPISLVWIVDQFNPSKFEAYLLFCLIFTVASFVLILLFSRYFQCNRRGQNQEIPLSIQSTEDTINQASTTFFDPFINCPFPFNLISVTRQDIILIVFLFLGLVTMVLSNGLAAQRMPIGNALPDIIQEHFHVADYLRINSNSSFQISNILILIQILLLIISELTVSQFLNVRRFVFIYGNLCFLRSVSFLLTTLPAPCAGSPKCPCADPEMLKLFKEGNIFKISFSWLFGLGMFLKLPQCGDLIISGHTMWLWLASRTICSVMEYAIPRPLNWLAIAVLITFTLVSLCYIVLSKNHYSIDVWFAFLFTELLFTLYNSMAENAVQPNRPFWSLCQKIIKYFETRPPKRILMQTRIMMQYNQ